MDTHQVVIKFPTPIGFTGVFVTPQSGKRAELDGPPTTNPVSDEVTINLKDVSDAQTLTITIQNVPMGSGSPSDVVIPMMVMAGDTNEDTRVNIGDTIQTKGNSGSLTNQDNFRMDVNLDGRINVGDVNFVKEHSGSSERALTQPRADQRR